MLYKIERLVEVMLKKVHILSILDCYYRLFPLIYISHDSMGITIQGSCEDRKILATTIPLHLGKLGGGCISIEVLKMDSWRVKNVFKSNNGVSYEAISSYIYKLTDHPKITEGISCESYPSTKKFLFCDGDPNGEVEIEVNEGAATFNNNKKRSHTQLDSRKQVIAFQDRVITINIKEAQHPLKREKQVIDKSSIMLKISTKSMHRELV